MVETAGGFRADILGNENRCPCPNAVGHDRHDHAGQQEQDAAFPARKAAVCNQHPKRDHGNEELHARTFLRHDKQSGRRVDMDAICHRFDTAEPCECGRHFCGDILQRRNDLVSERNEEEHVGQRKGEDEPNSEADYPESRTLECHDHAQLRDQIDVSRPTDEADGESKQAPKKARPPAPGLDPCHFIPAYPDEPCQYGQDQEDMAVGVDVPPLMGHRRPFP